MRFFLGFCLAAAAVTAAPPPELAAALTGFRSDPPPGWSFVQTTAGEGKSMVERCDATKPDYARWTLEQKDGHAPTEDDLKTYQEARSQRSRTGTAPRIVEQLVLDAAETVADTGERATYRCPLRPGEARDTTALALRATIVLHKPTGTIESIELGNLAPFSPTLGVKITEMKTVMTYSLPGGDAPSLPRKVATHMRGRAFYFKSLDGDLTVTFSDYQKVGKK